MTKPKKHNPADNFKGKAGPGRPKGSKDKISRDLKQLVLDTVKQLEGEDKALIDVAREDPGWFYQNFVKPMLPKEVGMDVSGDLTVVIKRLGDKDV